VEEARPARFHALDAVRGGALLLGIVFHACWSFLPSRPGVILWVVHDSHTSVILAVVAYVAHIFRMTTFFLLAGFFGRMGFQKKGPRGFVLDRLKRIALPLVVGWPFMAAALGTEIYLALGGKLPSSPPSFHFKLPAFPLTDLWFLYVLLLLYTETIILQGLVATFDRVGRWAELTDSAMRGLVQRPFGMILLAIPTAVSLWFLPHWQSWLGIPTPTDTLVPEPATMIAFSSAFIFGWLLHRQPELLAVWRQRWPLSLAAAVSLTTVGLWFVGTTPTFATAPHNAISAFYALDYALAVWAWTIAVVGISQRFLSGFSATRRYIADAAYWIYLIHLPLVIALQMAVSRLDFPALFKMGVIIAVSLSLLFGSYQLLVRHSFVGAWLNGRRLPRSRHSLLSSAGA
jgi:glucan biosynthesis protein C